MVDAFFVLIKHMKKSFLLMLSISFFFTACSNQQDSVSEADLESEQRAKEYLLDEPSAEFLVKIADGSLMGVKEGEAAQSKGTTGEIRAYGKLIVKDQHRLYAIMKTLAVHKKIQLPIAISAEKQDGLKELLAKKGSDFDNKFINMMRIDHERDIRLFTDALHVKDDEIRAFAVKYLPLIQAHLDKLNALKK
jgi:putative membrane protein